jgi:hypothetical protein
LKDYLLGQDKDFFSKFEKESSKNKNFQKWLIAQKINIGKDTPEGEKYRIFDNYLLAQLKEESHRKHLTGKDLPHFLTGYPKPVPYLGLLNFSDLDSSTPAHIAYLELLKKGALYSDIQWPKKDAEKEDLSPTSPEYMRVAAVYKDKNYFLIGHLSKAQWIEDKDLGKYTKDILNDLNLPLKIEK